MADTLILALLFFVVLLFLYYASGDVNDNESDNKEFEIDDLALHEKYKIKFSGRLSAKASQNLERVLSLLPEKVLTSAESLNIDRHFERYQPDNIGQCSYRDRKIDIHPNYIMYALIHEFAHARTFKVICDDIMANKMIEAAYKIFCEKISPPKRKSFLEEWMEIAGQVYIGEEYASVYPFKLFFPLNGCLTPRSKSNGLEDIAEFVNEVYCVAYDLPDAKIKRKIIAGKCRKSPVYVKKLNLLYQNGFFSEYVYKKVIGYFDAQPRASFLLLTIKLQI